MEMGFNHAAWPQGQRQGPESGGVNERLDWHGLRTRFLAAQAFRQANSVASQAGVQSADASFDRSAAQALAGFDDALHGINLTISADGKSPSANDEGVAGASKLGDQG